MKRKIITVILLPSLAAVLIGSTSQPGIASAAGPKSALASDSIQATAQSATPIDPLDLDAFLDDLLAAEMAEKHVPGVMVSVVQDGKLLLAKGYGYADLEGQVPVDPERTLFRVASLSKLFTWTAIMQLMEQGRLSLDTDINEYLDFDIPASFPQPITLRHLLSHTAGFEDIGLSNFKLQVDEMTPLGDWLRSNLPARVFPPGEVIAYSNYGAALAGYIVERASGLPFDDYVEQNVFVPLGMARSTFRQPLPENLAADMAKGYNYTGGQYVEGSFVFDVPYPAGAMTASAADMARFMVAHLQNGELDGRRILQEDTALQMHTRLYAPDPRLDAGMAHGFFDNTVNGQRILYHGGNLVTFNSGLYLIPEHNVGIFISTNGTSGATAVYSTVGALLDRYYPVTDPPVPESAAGFAERIAPYLGAYSKARDNFTSFERINGVFAPIRASLGSDGTLVLSGSSRTLRFAELEPGLLQDVADPGNRLAYHTGPDGRRFLTGVLGIGDPFALFRTPWYGTGRLHLLLISSGTLLLLGALIAWPIGFFIGRRRQPPASQPTPLPARLARWAAALFGLLLLVCLLGFAAIFANILPGFGVPRIWFGTPPLLSILIALSYVLGVLALAMLVFAVLAWVRRYWSLGGRIFYTLLALFALLITWSLVYWNLLL